MAENLFYNYFGDTNIMTSLALRIEKFAVYIIIIYMATMTGLYFHMDSRINVLQTLQNKSFEKYALKEQRHDESILKITNKFVELSDSVHELNSDVKDHLNSISNLLMTNQSRINKNRNDIDYLEDDPDDINDLTNKTPSKIKSSTKKALPKSTK